MKDKKQRIPENVRLKFIELRGKASRSMFANELSTNNYEVKPHTIRGIEDGDQAIPYELRLIIEDKYNISRDWLLTGEGPMTIQEKTYEEKLDEEYEKVDDDLKIVVHKYLEGRKGDKKALELLVKKLQVMIEMMEDG